MEAAISCWTCVKSEFYQPDIASQNSKKDATAEGWSMVEKLSAESISAMLLASVLAPENKDKGNCSIASIFFPKKKPCKQIFRMFSVHLFFRGKKKSWRFPWFPTCRKVSKRPLWNRLQVSRAQVVNGTWRWMGLVGCEKWKVFPWRNLNVLLSAQQIYINFHQIYIFLATFS